MRFAHPSSRARRIFKLSALTAAIWLSGCTVGPDFVRPEAPAGQQVTRAPVVTTDSAPVAAGAAQRFEIAAEVKREWWTLFESPVLNDLVARSLAENPTIDAAQASLRQARALVLAQRGFYFPTIGVGYEPTRQGNSNTLSPTLNSGDSPFTLNTAQVSVGFTPDVFGLNRRTVESLEAQAQTQKFLLDAAYITLATNVVTAAVQQAALRSQIRSTEEIIGSANRALEILKALAKIGYSSALDVAAQETLLAQAQQTLPPLNKQLEQTRNQI
ncbi:MAG: TolC family protein, partial [Burkholderiales bacterium]